MHYFVKLFCMLFLLSLASCASKKDVLYFQDHANFGSPEIMYQQSSIQPNDILDIKISTIVPEAALAYNRPLNPMGGGQSLDLLQLQGYLVNLEGMVNLPVLGAVTLSGLTTTVAERKIQQILEKGGHLQNPSVSVRLLNGKITVLGEVNRPGTISFMEQFLTVPQALGFAGDLTINGQRNNILLFRESEGQRQVFRLDLTKTDWMNNPDYLLRQNDVLVVNPNYARTKSAGFFGSSSNVLTIVSLLLSTFIVITR